MPRKDTLARFLLLSSAGVLGIILRNRHGLIMVAHVFR